MKRVFTSLLILAGFILASIATVLLEFNSSVTLAILVFTAAFFSTTFFTGAWIKIAQNAKLVGRDINKHNGGHVAESGGIGVILGISFGILAYIFIKTFFIASETHLVVILAMLITVLLAGILGFIDDIIGWKVGLKQWQKPLLTLPIAIPLMVISAGDTIVNLPIFGNVDLGIVYPLILIPIGIVGAANGFNMLAGLNGLEAGLGAIILSAMGIVAYTQGMYWLVMVVGIVVSALIGFLVFNRYPARVFPGDSLTYSMGAIIAAVAIVGDMQKVAVFLFSLYLVELILKGKNRFKGESFGIPQPNGRLKSPDKIISMTHVSMRLLEKTKGYATEKSTVILLYIIQAIIAAIVLYPLIFA